MCRVLLLLRCHLELFFECLLSCFLPYSCCPYHDQTQLECGDDTSGLMTDEEMLACFGDADVCVFAADYDEVTC